MKLGIALTLTLTCIAPGLDSGREAQQRTVRYFALEGDVDRAKLSEGLGELTQEGGEHRILEGPQSPVSRPKSSFLALEVPVETSVKSLVRAMKKSCKRVEELAWTSFEGVSVDLPTILGQSARDCVIGMASPMRWFDAKKDRKHFFYLAGKLDAEEIADRFQKLFGPFDAGEIGTLRTSEVRLAFEPVEKEAAVKKALKALSKQEQVRKADLQGEVFVLEVAWDGMARSLPPVASGEPTEGTEPTFDPESLYGVLEEAGLVPIRN